MSEMFQHMMEAGPNRQARSGLLMRGLPDAVLDYLAHIGAGVSIRDLARISACHASTISRRIRRIEQQRDDPLVDSALRRMEARLEQSACDLKGQIERELKRMNETSPDHMETEALADFEKETMRILRRLCETGAVLAIAKDMDMAVVVRETAGGSTTRTGVVAQEIAQAMALHGWIETESSGRVLRYSITSTGRDQVKDLLDRFAQDDPHVQPHELAEAPAAFAPAPVADNLVEPPLQGTNRRGRYSLAESPLTALARRKNKAGEAFLSDDLVRCGERLREDFELAQMGPRVSQDWDQFLTGGVQSSHHAPAPGGHGPEAAKARVEDALKDLGPGLSDVALRCCCYLEGLETAEKHMGWSARSGKIVLRIALQRLKRHYEETAGGDAQMIG